MNKWFVIVAVASVLVIALTGVGAVYAQEAQPTTTETPGYGLGWMSDCSANSAACEDYPIHELMQAALAEQFGISVEELNAMDDQEETLWQLAQEKGLSFTEFHSRMSAARQQAFAQAAEQGLVPAYSQPMRGQMGMNQPFQQGYGDCTNQGEGPAGPGGFRWSK